MPKNKISLGKNYFQESWDRAYQDYRKKDYIKKNTKVVTKLRSVPTGYGGLVNAPEKHLVDKHTGEDYGVIEGVDYSKIKFNTEDPIDNFLNWGMLFGAGGVRLASTAVEPVIRPLLQKWLPKMSFELGLGTYGAAGAKVGAMLDAGMLGWGAYHGLTDMYNNGINLGNSAETALSFLPIASNIYNRFAVPMFRTPKFRAKVNNPTKKIGQVYHVTPSDSGLTDLSKAYTSSADNIGVFTTTEPTYIRTLAKDLGIEKPRVVSGWTATTPKSKVPDIGTNNANLYSKAVNVDKNVSPISSADDTFKLNLLTEGGVRYTAEPSVEEGTLILRFEPNQYVNLFKGTWPNASSRVNLAADHTTQSLLRMPEGYFAQQEAMLPLNLKWADILHREGKFPMSMYNPIEKDVPTLVVHPDDIYTTGFNIPDMPNTTSVGEAMAAGNVPKVGPFDFEKGTKSLPYYPKVSSTAPTMEAPKINWQIKPLMKGSVLERSVNKKGFINRNAIEAQLPKMNGLDRAILQHVLDTKFLGMKLVPFESLRLEVSATFPTYSYRPASKYSDYGLSRIGYPTEIGLVAVASNDKVPAIITKYKIGKKHYDNDVIGHTRYFIDPESNTFTVLESLSDVIQQAPSTNYVDLWNKAYESYSAAVPVTGLQRYKSVSKLKDLISKVGDINEYKQRAKEIYDAGNTGYDTFEAFVSIPTYLASRRRIPNYEASRIELKPETSLPKLSQRLDNRLYHIGRGIKERPKWMERLQYLVENTPTPENMAHFTRLSKDNGYLTRQMYENMNMALDNGASVMRYPTPQTAAKIQGYPIKVDGKWTHDFSEPFSIKNFEDAHQVHLRKYEKFPKIYESVFGKGSVRKVTDIKGNSWYEVNIPEDFRQREFTYKKGGKLNTKK